MFSLKVLGARQSWRRRLLPMFIALPVLLVLGAEPSAQPRLPSGPLVPELASAAPAPEPEAAALPAQAQAEETKSIPWSQLGAEASKQASGEALSVGLVEPGRARLETRFQRLVATVEAEEGLWLSSTAERPAGEEEAGRFRVLAHAVGRGEGTLTPIPRRGEVAVADERVRWLRPGLTEEYSVSVDGLRQDFLLAERPAGQAPLRLELAVDGARAETADYGARLHLANGRRLAYARLHVEDAQGQVLAAHMQVAAAGRIALMIDDARATYPLRIDPTFSDDNWIRMGGTPAGAGGTVRAIVADGVGNLYIGGELIAVGSQLVNGIARWDGTDWQPLGNGVSGIVNALAFLGSDLYVGGAFTQATGPGGTKTVNNIARWDGTDWQPLGIGVSGGSVLALAVSGSDLYVGGGFTHATGLGGTQTVNRIARWNGTDWQSLGSGVTGGGSVYALAVSGNDLYVGGSFVQATGPGGTQTVNGIARWNGTDWQPMGSGVSDGVGVYTLAVSGGDLYVGGRFTHATGPGGTKNVNNVARWSGTDWQALGNGVNGEVWALAVSGDLYVGGYFTYATGSGGPKTVNNIARWNGTDWQPLGDGVSGSPGVVNTLAVSGGDLYVGGRFTQATGLGGAKTVNRIARWNGSHWSALGASDASLNGSVRALATGSDGDLYVGGDLITIEGLTVNRIARWNGTGWQALGNGVNGQVLALAISGGDLYVGGYFTQATGPGGTKTVGNIARWDGVDWQALGNGVFGGVQTLAVSGGDVYVGGLFTQASGPGGTKTVNNIARWNGTDWQALGEGVSGLVRALAVRGGDLYVGGSFTQATGPGGTKTVNNIARWDGTDWQPLGIGVSGGSGAVVALAVSGGDLYVGGSFTQATGPGGPKTVNNIARWNGTDWQPLGGGVLGGAVYALAAIDGDLYVGGIFGRAIGPGGATTVNRIARWNGTDWQTLGNGVSGGFGIVNTLAVSGGDLYAGGDFWVAGNKVSPYLARADLHVRLYYDGNGHTGGAVPTDATRYAPGASATVRGNTGALVRTGHSFNGWNTQADGAGVSYAPSDTLTLGGNDVTLYAVWQLNSYTIAANLSGPGTVVGIGTYNHGSTATLVVTPAAGYHFVNWTEDGSEVSTVANYSFTVTGPRTLVANVALNSYTVSASAGAGGAVSPTSQNVNHGGAATITVTPDAGYSIADVSGCTGTLVGNTYTTGPITADCTVSASFSLNSYTVSASAGPGGAISPASQSILYGSTAVLTLTPDLGYEIDTVSGCDGSLAGNSYTTVPITGACTVNASFRLTQYTVTATAGAGGAISPSSQAVEHGSTTAFTLTPDLGYEIDTVDGCAGTLTGNTYTTGAITGACTVNASFRLKQYTVTATASAGGGISPGSATVAHGDTASFTVTPDAGYVIVGVSGCGGGLIGNSYTTGPITAACTVSASFALNSHTVTASAGPGGDINPKSQSVEHGKTAAFSVVPQVGYEIGGVSGCGGSLSGGAYTTGPITGACAITASFVAARYEVDAVAGSGGSISPARQSVEHGGVVSFTLTPAAGYGIAMVSGCGGSLSGQTYTTAPITSACTVMASFSRDRYQVSTQVSAGGSLSPDSQMVDHGQRASFTVSTDDGYRLARISGCEGGLEGETYTTGPITGACTVSAEFASDLPVFGVLEPVSLDATGLFTPLPELSLPPAHDRHGNVLTPTLVGAKSHYAPGRHTLTWRVEDSEGRLATAEQRLDVWPQVSLSKDLRLGYGAEGAFQIVLNGEAPEYPLTVSYGVGGSAQYGVDHALVGGSVTFTQGTSMSVPLKTLAGSGVDTTLTVALEPGVNLGARQQLIATLVAGNAAPRVALRAWQGGQPVAAVARDGGTVSLMASVTDPNPQDSHQGEWRVPAEAVVSASADGLSLSLDPQSLAVGSHMFELTVHDSGSPMATTAASLQLSVIAQAPVLGGGDSNGNGIPDDVEGAADSNGNGIPDYLDGDLGANVLPSQGGAFAGYLLEAEPGLSLGLGAYAIGQGLGGSQVVAEALPQADSLANVGGYFDFRVGDLPEVGQSVRVVLPQQAAVPAGAVYRKFSPIRVEWYDFVEDGRNGLASAPGEAGYCPPPGDSAYTPGLTEGHWCVQLTLEDGGPNDADGAANGEVRDPGGVAVAAAAEPAPERRGGGGGADLALLVLGLLWMVGLRHRRVG